jgi:lipopolysaccharide export system protein LptA
MPDSPNSPSRPKPRSNPQVDSLLEISTAAFFFVTPAGQPFVVLPLRSPLFQYWLLDQYVLDHNNTPPRRLPRPRRRRIALRRHIPAIAPACPPQSQEKMFQTIATRATLATPQTKHGGFRPRASPGSRWRSCYIGEYMRGTRWLLLVAIAAMLIAVVTTYRLQQQVLRRQAPPKPTSLPAGLLGSAEDWQWAQTVEGRPQVQIRAKNVKQEKGTGKTELDQVELRIFHKKENQFDLVKSAHAVFTEAERRLYSEGEVEITLGVPVEGPPAKKRVSIKSSGVMFESATGKSSTERPANFEFENGWGKAVGASYDPSAKELHMNGQVELHWKSPGPNTKPMKLEAGELIYKEAASVIWLVPWARLTRENAVIDAGNTIVTLKDGAIHLVDAQKARGIDKYPNRQLEYSADQLWVSFSEQGQVEKIWGENNARLVSASEGSVTTVTTHRVDMEFAGADAESALSKVVASGNSMVEWKPVPADAPSAPETRVLHSQTIEMKMRPGGREIESMETQSPGRLDFLPNRPAQRRRQLDAEHLWIAYGAENRIQSFRAVGVQTSTDPDPRVKNGAVAKTRSKNLAAEFNPKTGQMARMEQWEEFAYQEGDRQARASRAVQEAARNLITLETGARMWDASGSTSADRIVLDQQNGNFTAEGHVNSSRLPDKKNSGSELLSSDEPLQATARAMTSADRNQLVRYEGDVVLWQGANRIQARQVEIDRRKKRLMASESVVTEFLEKSDEGPSETNPALTVVKAGRLLYTDENRLAHYSGGVRMSRPGLQVKASEIKAFLAESEADSRIDKAFANGSVEIIQTALDRKRIGTGEHAQYYTGEEKIVLGGDALLVDAKRGNSTRGAELTYYVNDDRLLVKGAPQRPVVSRIRRK